MTGASETAGVFLRTSAQTKGQSTHTRGRPRADCRGAGRGPLSGGPVQI